MAKLEKLFFDDPENQIVLGYDGPLVVEQATDGQYRLDWLQVEQAPVVGGVYRRLGGRALLSNAEFTGYLTTNIGQGSLSLRHE